MAHYFSNSLPRGASLGDSSEYLFCVQSISLLRSLQGSVCQSTSTTGIPDSFHSSGLELFNRRSAKATLFCNPSLRRDPDQGILTYMARAAEAWHMARAYAASQVSPDDPPPWDPQSDYSHVMLRNLELDCTFPLKYRFATNNFGDTAPEVLHEQRQYWGPWMLIQFLHAATPTLVNHPFLLSMRLKHFRHMMPQTFMHQSFEQISRHTAWIICYLDLLEKQQFQVSDPVIAHCVVIVATIHLQHSFVEYEALRSKAKLGYDKCIRFLDRMKSLWPSVLAMVCYFLARFLTYN